MSTDALPNQGRRLSPAAKLSVTFALSVALLSLLTIAAPNGQQAAAQTGPGTTIGPGPVTTLTTVVLLFDTLAVRVKGPGSVTVGGSACGQTGINTPTSAAPAIACARSFSQISTVTFSVVAATLPGDDAVFAGWEGAACTGGNTGATCTLTISGDTTLVAVFEDSTQPPATIQGPADATVFEDEDGTFSVPFVATSAADPSTTATCAVDGGSFSTCSTPAQLAGLGDGNHTLQLRSTDPSGNTRNDSKTWNFYTLPDTTIADGPPALDGNSTATFRLENSKAGGTVLCKLDAAPAFTACPADGRFTGLADGLHTLAARAQHDYENAVRADPSPVTRSWTVDTTPPDTTLSDGPTSGLLTNLRATVFGFSSEPGATFECRVDGGDFGACAGGVAGRASFDTAPGPHSFAVRAKDLAGNVDPTPAERSWTVIADNDGDGHVIPADCNDAAPHINPAAVDVPDNGIDEDCRGGDALAPVPGSRVSFSFGAAKTFTVLKQLVLKDVPAGSTVTVTCKQPKRPKVGECPKKFTKTDVGGNLSLKRFIKRKLRVGTVLEIRVLHAGMTTLVKSVKLRRGRSPVVTTRCVRAGQKKLGACPS